VEVVAQAGGDMVWVSWCQVENMISTAMPQTNKALKPSEHKFLKAAAGSDMMWVSWCQVENMISTTVPQTNAALKPSE
jgi:hypothetical protein